MKNSATVLTYLPLSYHYRQKMYYTSLKQVKHYILRHQIAYHITNDFH